MRTYPAIDVHVDLHDRPVNLQEDGYDMAIRTGALSDSSLIAKRLAPDRHVIVASPGYLARKGCPQRPEDLADHDCLVLGESRQWSFSRERRREHVRVTARSGPTTASCSAGPPSEGLGLIRASELEVLCELRSGKLVQVLPRLRGCRQRGAVGALSRAPSTCCRACARCSIFSPPGSAMRATAGACRR